MYTWTRNMTKEKQVPTDEDDSPSVNRNWSATSNRERGTERGRERKRSGVRPVHQTTMHNRLRGGVSTQPSNDHRLLLFFAGGRGPSE